MSKRWFISCDRCGRESQPAPSKAEVNELARKDGWRLGHPNNGGVDLCPDCYAPRCVSARA